MSDQQPTLLGSAKRDLGRLHKLAATVVRHGFGELLLKTPLGRRLHAQLTGRLRNSSPTSRVVSVGRARRNTSSMVAVLLYMLHSFAVDRNPELCDQRANIELCLEIRELNGPCYAAHWKTVGPQ